jgi:hypothetical protein
MRRSLGLLLAMLAMAQSPAMAQTCMGLASYTSGPIQVTASGSFNDVSNTFGTTAGYGIPSGVYGSVEVTTTAYEPMDGSTLGFAARAGYQVNLGKTGRTQICPSAGFAIGLGPNDAAAGIDQFGRSFTVGLNVGTELASNPRMVVVPSAGFSYAHSTQRAENNAGTELFEIPDSYLLAQIGVGLVLNRRVSVRPAIDIPLGRLESSHPDISLTLGYSFGR